jgi:hypothetical protein
MRAIHSHATGTARLFGFDERALAEQMYALRCKKFQGSLGQ